MSAALAASSLAAALLAWTIARREPSHRPIAVFFAALSSAWTGLALAGALGYPGAFGGPLGSARALAIWALARAVMERRSPALPIAIGAALASAHLALSPPWTPLLERSAWGIGTVGGIVSIGRAMRSGVEPKLAHLVVLGLTALGAARIVIGHERGPTGLAPSAFEAGAAVLVQARWLAQARRA